MSDRATEHVMTAGSEPAIGLLDPWKRLTVDGLSRLSARARAKDIAVAEAPDTGVWFHRSPVALTHAALLERAEHLARQMLALGLKRGERVLLHMPNVSELGIALIGCLTAGLVPATAPIGWGAEELRAAADLSGARAILTVARYGQMRPADVARAVAAEVFTIRLVCAFGVNVPNGVVALDSWEESDIADQQLPPPVKPEDIAVVTFERREAGMIALARTHQQLVCEALALSTTGRVSKSSHLVTTIPAATALGVVATVVVPVLTGAAVHLHGPFESRVLLAQLAALPGANLLVPAALEAVLPQIGKHLAQESGASIGTPILLHRWPAPETHLSLPPVAPMRVIDLHAIGEQAILPMVRFPGDPLKALPTRLDHPAAHTLSGKAPLLECALDNHGQLLVRGFSVPSPFGRTMNDEAGWRGTGLTATRLGIDQLRITPSEGDSARHAA